MRKSSMGIAIALTLCLLTLGFACERDSVQKVTPPDPVAELRRILEVRAARAEKSECGPASAERMRAVAQIAEKNGIQALSGKLFLTCALLKDDEYVFGMDGLLVEFVAKDIDVEAVEFIAKGGRVVATSPPSPHAGKGSSLADGVEYRYTFLYLTPSIFAPGEKADTELLKSGWVEDFPIVRLKQEPEGLSVRLRSGGYTSDAIPIVVEQKSTVGSNLQ